MTTPGQQVTDPHRYPLGYRPIITEQDQLAIDAELSERFGRGETWLRHHGDHEAETAGLAIETRHHAAVLVAGVRLYDLIVPNRYRTASVVFHLMSRPIDPDMPEGTWLYYWPDIVPAPCQQLPQPPSIGPHAPLSGPDGDTLDLATILDQGEEVGA